MNINIDGLAKHVEGTGDFITVDAENCNGCGRCLVICVMNLWKKREGKIMISEEYKSKCLECAACAQVCEAGAINFRYPSGGTGVVYEQG